MSGARARTRRHGVRRHGVRRWIAMTAAAVAAALLVASPAPAETEAAWSDAEVASGGFTALTVPPPVATAQCVGKGSLLGLLSSSLTIHWKLPAGYTTADARISYSGYNGLVPVTDTLTGTSLKTVSETGGYATTATGGLLSATLGGTRVLAVRIVHSSGWESIVLTATGTWPALGLGDPTCVVTPPPA